MKEIPGQAGDDSMMSRGGQHPLQLLQYYRRLTMILKEYCKKSFFLNRNLQ